MDAAQDLSGQEQGVLADEVMDSLGEENGAQESESNQEQESNKGHDPLYVQKRLKQQKRAHERELRALHDKIDALQSQLLPPENSYSSQTMKSDEAPFTGGSLTPEHIHEVVNHALRHKEMEERKIKEAEQRQHIHRQYGELEKHLNDMSDKYDDYDDVVRGDDVPFTTHIRDAALLLPRSGHGAAGEVLYKLGKNREELRRISQLHPLEQAREVMMLSHALSKEGEQKSSSESHSSHHMSGIKNNPVTNSKGITEKTSPAEIRARMREGKFK